MKNQFSKICHNEELSRLLCAQDIHDRELNFTLDSPKSHENSVVWCNFNESKSIQRKWATTKISTTPILGER